MLLSYSPDPRGTCPDRLFFKQNPQAAKATFYQKIAPALTHTVVPICYDAQYDDANSHVLLAYVGQTHFAPPEALPMPLVYHETMSMHWRIYIPSSGIIHSSGKILVR